MKERRAEWSEGVKERGKDEKRKSKINPKNEFLYTGKYLLNIVYSEK